MKLSLRFALVSMIVACFATLPFLTETAAKTARLKEPTAISASRATPTAPPVVSVGVSIDCSSAASGTAPSGTVASITASNGDCVSRCTGVGGTATFNSSGKASTTLKIDCKGGPSDLAGCEFTAFWQDKSGNIVRVRARLQIRGHTYTVKFRC